VTFATTLMRDEKSAGERRTTRDQSRRQPGCALPLLFPLPVAVRNKKDGGGKKKATPAKRYGNFANCSLRFLIKIPRDRSRVARAVLRSSFGEPSASRLENPFLPLAPFLILRRGICTSKEQATEVF